MPALLLTLAAGATGVAAGLLGGLFGIGGGVIAIPILGLLYGVDQQVAQGTTLVMVVPNVLLGFWRYYRYRGFDLRIAGALAVSATISSFPAARFATGLDPRQLRIAFAIFLAGLAALIAGRVWYSDPVKAARAPLPWIWSAVVGFVGGIVSGLFGVGGAFIAPPALTAFFGVRQAEAQGMALALVAPGAVVALATYAHAGQVAWDLGIPLALGGFLAISAGVAVAHRLPEERLQLGFCGLMLVTAVLLVVR